MDAALRTAEPNIFAIGDVVGEPMLAHKASHEARVAVEAILGHKVAFEPQAIPAVVFTDPEVAWCGLTETEAQKQGRKVEIAKFPWAALGRAVAIDRPDGLTKLIIDPATERVLGVGIVGAGAGELIAEGVLAVEMAALATDLKLSIHPHPTLSETLMEAAEVFFGQSTHVLSAEEEGVTGRPNDYGSAGARHVKTVMDAWVAKPRAGLNVQDLVTRATTMSIQSTATDVVRAGAAAAEGRRRGRHVALRLARIAPIVAVVVLVFAVVGRLPGWPPRSPLIALAAAALGLLTYAVVARRVPAVTDKVAPRGSIPMRACTASCEARTGLRPTARPIPGRACISIAPPRRFAVPSGRVSIRRFGPRRPGSRPQRSSPRRLPRRSGSRPIASVIAAVAARAPKPVRVEGPVTMISPELRKQLEALLAAAEGKKLSAEDAKKLATLTDKLLKSDSVQDASIGRNARSACSRPARTTRAARRRLPVTRARMPQPATSTT